MFKKILATCQTAFVKLIASFKRFPEALFAAMAMVVVLICLNHCDFQDQTGFHDSLVKLAMVLALGIPTYLIVRLWFERAPHWDPGLKIALYLGVLSGLIAYYYLGIKNFTIVPMTRYSALTIAGYLTMIFIPYFDKRKNFELYCVRLLTNLTIAYFYASVLYLGVAATLFTIDKLFAATWGGKIYFDFWLIAAGIFAPAYFLAEIPPFQAEFQIENYPKVLKILLLYIVIPLLIVYSIILYAYFAKIIIFRSWPEGIVSHLVLWYGLICSGVRFLLDPLRPAVKWLNKLLAAFPLVLFPLLAMLFVSMGIRVHAYGITESRYFVLSAGMWITGWMLYCLLNKKANNLLLPFSLAIIALLTVTGPWSAYSVSKSDQSHRFCAILKKYDMIHANKIVRPKRPISAKARTQIISILNYFQSSHSLRDLRYLPANFQLSQTPRVFGFKTNKDDYVNRYIKSCFYYDISNNQANQLLNIQDFDYCINNLRDDTTQIEPRQKLEVAYTSGPKKLTITLRDHAIYRQKITSLITPLFKKETPAVKQAITYWDENERLKVFYVFHTIAGTKDQTTGEIEFNSLTFTIYIKLK